jgi:hypothetical protein
MSTSRPSPLEKSPDLHQILDELDRLEELLEDMAELGVSSRDEAEARMRQLNVLVDELEGA